MKEQPDSQWIEELLKDEEPYIDNDGFSKQVVDSLPKRKRWTWRTKRRLIKVGAVLAASAAALVGISGLELDLSVLNTVPPFVLMTISVVALAGAIAAACIWVVTDRA